MTLVSLPAPIAWPGIVGHFNTSPALGSPGTLDAAGEYIAYVLVAKENMVVSHVGFRVGNVSGSPTGELRIETIDPATGLPTGTLWGTTTNVTSGTLSANTWTLLALTASATINKGQVFCVKIGYVSGTSFNISNGNQFGGPLNSNLPYLILNTGTPTKSFLSNNFPILAFGSDSTTFYQVPGTIPITAVTVGSFNNTSAAKRGLRFTLPFKCRIVGIRWYNSSSVGDFNVGIYDDTTGTAVELSSSVTAYEGDVSGANAVGVISSFLDNAVAGDAGTTYRAAIEPSSATNASVATFTLPSTSYRSATPFGTVAHYTTFVTGGWTDTATDQIPLMDILIDQLDDGAGGGGGNVAGVIG